MTDQEDYEPESGYARVASDAHREQEQPRHKLIAAAQARWVDALTDLGGRNTLLYYKDRRPGRWTWPARSAALDRFLRTGSIRLTRLFRDVDARADAIRRMQVIYRKARELLEERGIRAGYLATGIARWDELFLEPAAPVLLRGLTITPTRARHDDFDLALDDDYEVNPVLLHKLASVFGAATEELADEPPGQVGELLTGPRRPPRCPGSRSSTGGSSARSPTPSCRWCGTCRRRASCWATATWSPPSPATRRPRNCSARSDPAIGAADGPAAGLAGGRLLGAGRRLLAAQRHRRGAGRAQPGHPRPARHRQEPDHRQPDRRAGGAGPEGAVRRGEAGRHRRGAVPAQGRRPGGMVLDIHEGTRDRLRIARDLGDALDEAQRTAEPDVSDLHRRLRDRQQRLSQHAAALHRSAQAVGTDAVRGPVRAAGHPTSRPALTVRLAAPEQHHPARLADRIRDELREFAHLGGFALRPDSTPWFGAALRTPDQAPRRPATWPSGSSTHGLPAAGPPRRPGAAEETGLRPPRTYARGAAVMRLYAAVRADPGRAGPGRVRGRLRPGWRRRPVTGPGWASASAGRCASRPRAAGRR